MKKVYKIKNLDCANCALKLENKLKKVEGVIDCKVSFIFQKITLEYNKEDVLEDIKKICKKVEPDLEFVGE